MTGNERHNHPLATIIIKEDGDELNVSCDFEQDISIPRMFYVIGASLQGIMEVAKKIGSAKGMTETEISAAMFPDKD